MKTTASGQSTVGTTYYKSVSEYIDGADEELSALYDSVRDYMLTLGDDVQERVLKFYIAFKRIKNFACVEVRPGVQTVKIYLKVDPTSVEIDPTYMRDMRKIGHYGTGDLEIDVTSLEVLEKANANHIIVTSRLHVQHNGTHAIAAFRQSSELPVAKQKRW